MDLLTVTHFLNGFLMIALPVALGIFLVTRFKLSWKIWLIGGATFIISQVFHIPFNSYVLNPSIGSIQQILPGSPGILIGAIMLGLSAGIFEECARFGMFHWWLQNNRSWKAAVLAGAGHGGVEAIALGGLVLWVFINLVAVRHADLSKLNISTDQLQIAQQQIQTYWSLPWYSTLLGVVERIFTIPFHIMASVLVLQVFTRKPGQLQLGWLALAIFMHMLMDASVTYIGGALNPYIAEAILGGLAVMDVIILFALRQPELEVPEPTDSLAPKEPASFIPKPVEETTENLEKTRYQ